jgi:elongation factor G
MPDAAAPPPPLLEVAIEPQFKKAFDELFAAAERLASADRDFVVEIDPEFGQLVLGGAGERHLDGVVSRLRQACQVAFNVGEPQVAYREIIGRPAVIEAVHKAWCGPQAAFAKVFIRFEPGAAGSGFKFEDATHEEILPKAYVPGVIDGLDAARQGGLLAGFPVTDFTATLSGGAWHDLDSNAQAFGLAAEAAFQKLRDEADPRVVEPVVRFELTAPQDCAACVRDDIESRRGTVHRVELRDCEAFVTAEAPLSNLSGYETTLAGISRGRAKVHQMTFVRYAPLPEPLGDPPSNFPTAVGLRR